MLLISHKYSFSFSELIKDICQDTIVYVQNQTRIQVNDHKLYTLQESIKALCANDTKRYIPENPMIRRTLNHVINNIISNTVRTKS